MLWRLARGWGVVLALVGCAVGIGRISPPPGVLMVNSGSRNLSSVMNPRNLFLFDIRTGVSHNLDHPRLGQPRFSPDHQHRLYIETTPAESRFHVTDRFGRPSASFKVNVPDQFMAPTDVHWSLDGRYLAYLSWDMTFPVQPPVLVIYTVEGDLVRAHSFPEDMTIQVYWSPDSRYLAYLAHGASAPQAGNIGLGFFDMDAPTDDAHNLLPVGETVNFLDTTSGGWSYDARYFAFEGRDDRDQHKTLLAATLDGEIVRLPRPVTTSDVVYMWSPTDSRIAYDTPTQTLDIYDMDAGQVVAQVDAGPTAALSPVGWLPDGRSLLYRWFDGAYVQSATFYIALFDGQTQVDLLTQVGVPNLTLTVGQSPVLLANNVVYRLTDDNNRAERLSGTEVLDIAYAAWSPDGEQLLLTSLFQNIYLLDTNDAAPSVRLLPFRPSATNFAYWHNFAGESD